MDPKALQCILGHSNISITLDYYIMVNADQSRKALEMYGNITKGIADKDAESEKKAQEEKTFEKKASDGKTSERKPRKRKGDDDGSMGYMKLIQESDDSSFVMSNGLRK